MSRLNSSALWEFFQKLDNEKKAKCNSCGEVYSFKTSTANLKTHLRRKHLNAYTSLCTAQSTARTPEQSRGQEPADDVQPQPSSSSSDAASASTSTAASTIPIYRAAQQLIDRYGISKKKVTLTKKRQIDNDLADLFIDSYHPFSLVEERAFKKFARHIPGYDLPSRKTVSNILIPTLYDQTVLRKKEEKNNIEFLSLTTDLWTSRVNDAYIAVTGHYLTKDLVLKTFLLKCAEFKDTHSSTNIQAALLETTNEWNLTNKINFIVSDNAPNVKKAIADIGWKHYGCYGHTLNLIVQDALNSVQASLDKVKTIVRHFKTSTAALEKLLKAQSQEKPDVTPKRLIQEVPTRWNSTFAMLQRFVELENQICATVAVLKKDLPILTLEEWTVFHELCKVLKPFDEATKAMSGEDYMTASTIIVMTRCLKESCDQLLLEGFTVTTNNIITVLRTGLDKRFEGVERSGTFSICTLLDPRYKTNVFSDTSEAAKAKKVLEEILATDIRRRHGEKQPQQSTSTSASVPVRDKFSPWTILNNIVGTQQQQVPLSCAIIVSYKFPIKH
ncbi:zinc finger BED domain-containing protein 4-like [Maniola jurtina]|uniref:zinc finger BED domain-containing protein 4-like n=1 Tax=Maniola jurtina TaxID=191418 RepID=UPI001E68FB2C|nr:zinc finger BED domain-containing protein 4-like [Maniola jurtina]